MKSIVNRIVVVVMIGALASIAAFAKTHKHRVTFENDIKVNGTLVKKGSYEVKFDDESGQLEIVKNGKGTDIEVSADGKVLERGKTHDEKSEPEHEGK